jgi:hypothetical protein
MRRLPLSLVALLGALGLTAAPAQATFHLEKVNEVLLASATGDASVQFVELLDKGGTEESFPPIFAPFKLVVFDAAGAKRGEQTLDPSGLRAAAMAGTPYLLSTAAADTALGVKGDEALSVALPPDAAQICFQGNPGNVSCITYGTITTPVAMSSQGTGTAHGPVPAAGESDQRQADDTVVSAAPTPKAENAKPTPPPPAPNAFAGVKIGSGSARVDGKGRAPVSLTCPAAASGRCSGSITLSAAGKRIGRASFSLAPGARHAVRVKLSAAARRTLAAKHRLSTRATVVASDAAKQSKTTSRKLTLRGR